MSQTSLSDPLASPPTAPLPRRSLLERSLSIVAEVRPGEGLTALLLGASLFLLLMAYYIIKPVREALILQHPAGAEYKSWLGAAIAILLLLVVPIYGALADRLPRNRLVSGVTLFFASHLVLFYLASQIGGLRESLALSLIFFVWVGIFNMMLVAQLWAFANDVYTEEQGKRLFVIVGLGASFGAIAGGAVKAALASVFDIFQLLLVSALALVGVALMAQLVHRRESGQRATRSAPSSPPVVPSLAPRPPTTGAFAMVLRDRYLSLIAAFSLVFTFVNTNGEYMLGKLIKAEASQAIASGALLPGALLSFIDAKYNSFFAWTNTLSFLLQFLVVSRLVQRAGISRAFFIFPVVALFDGLSVAVAPVLAVIFVGKIAENSTDYSLNNTLRQMLWLPTTREMKYKAKQAIDTFFIRMGDVASGTWVVLAASVLGLQVRGFAITNGVLVVLWLWIGWGIVKVHRELVKGASAAPATPVPGSSEAELS
jgi:AAA family ATP:ADP antiporter